MTNLNEHAQTIEKATFGMGCFWGPDTLFGSLPGVIQTEVGFAGGTSKAPTYRNIGDHTESIDITFDPALLSYEDLLRLFWQNHDATKDRFYKERQYISLLLYRNHTQNEQAEKIKAEQEQLLGKELQTEFQPYNIFYPAEDYHQKYFLRRFKQATKTIQQLFPDEAAFIHSTIAARLNGFVRERTTLKEIKEEIHHWGLPEEQRVFLEQTLTDLRW